MSDLDTLLERNRSVIEQFEDGDLPIRPRLSTILLTCLDARVDPAHLFRLGLGEAFVMRNAGGRVTPGVVNDLAILGALRANMPASATPPQPPELAIMHHSDCGLARLAGPPVQQDVARRLGLSEDEVAAMAVTDPAKSVEADIERLRNEPSAPDELIVSGLVYDVRSGAISQVVAPGSLRSG